MDIFEEKPKVNPAKTKKPNKQKSSNHRDNKTGAHTTIGGRGIVGRIKDKNKNGK